VDDQLIAGLARDQIAQMAPQELPLFRAQSQAYFSDPTKALQRRKPKEDMLGFGAEAAVTFLTPVVLEVTRSVIVYLVAEVEKTAKTESAGVVHNLVRQLFKKFAPASGGNAAPGTQPAALTAAQLAEVRRLAFEKARQLNLAESQANLLADSMVGSLAIAPT
jgi:hypothetical protein